MTITPEEISKIALLSRLKLDASRLELFSGQFNAILDHMADLNRVDTAAVEPMYSPSEHGTVFREDVVRKDCSREAILSNAPDSDGRFFRVPKII